MRHDDNGDGPSGDVLRIDNLARAYCLYTPTVKGGLVR